MLSDWELWACANKVIAEYGLRAEAFADERIAALLRDGDTSGVAVWRAIANRIERLRDDDPNGKVSH